MSLVGTRPPTVDEWEKYELHHRSRMSIKPGITGMWQASGRSDITDFEEVVKLDTEYIENWSIGLDVKILLKTVTSVLKSEGCPSICEKYKQVDSRIKVIHKKNGGLSDARNAGLKIAEGKWITFIDSDDYVGIDFLKELYRVAVVNETDISICDYSTVALL